MTISSSTTKVIVNGNGVTTAFNYNFLIPDKTSVQVIYTSPAGANTILNPSLYNISGVGNPSGGVVTYPLVGSPIATGSKLTIRRVVPYSQKVDINNQSAFYPLVIEGALDALEMQIQQLAEDDSRAPKFDVTYSGTVPVIESPTDGYYAYYDAASGHIKWGAGGGGGGGAVTSVNSKTGTVVLGASDIAGFGDAAYSNLYSDLDSKPSIPSKTSDLTNDSGFIVSGALTHSDIGDFTEAAQDAAGAMATNTSTVHLTYNDGANTLTADFVGTLNDVGTPTADFSMGSHKITSLLDPTNAQDAASKAYVDARAAGILPNPPVVAATTGALPANTYNNGASGVGATLTGNSNGALAAQDGVTLTVNQRLLVKDEATGANNGIYQLSTVGDGSNPYVLTRVTDADQAAEVGGGLNVFVQAGGTANANSTWVIISPTGSATIGTTALVFTKSNQSAVYTQSTGITITGYAISVDTSVTCTLTGSQTLANKTMTNAILNGTLTGTAIKNENSMVSNSTTAVPTQASVKAYVDAQVGTVAGGGVFINAKASPYNATGDGTTNDTAAIQAALDAAYAAGGGVVYLPVGVYRVQGTGTASDGALVIKDKVSLEGAGMGATVIKLLNGQQALGDITGIIRSPTGVQTRQYAVRNLTIDGNKANVTTRAIGFYAGVSPSKRSKASVSSTTATITTYTDDLVSTQTHGLSIGQTVYIQNENNPGLTGDFVVLGTGFTTTQFQVTVASGTASDASGYTWTYGAAFSLIADEAWKLQNVEAQNCYAYGIDPHERSRWFVISGCISHDNGADAASDNITLDGCFNFVLENCVVYGSGRNGIGIVTGSSYGVIENCTSYGNAQYGLADQRGSTTIPRGKGNRWIGNTSYGNTQYGMRLHQHIDGVIEGNNFSLNGRHGIRCEGSLNCIISSNIFRDNNTAGGTTYDDLQINESLLATPKGDGVTYPSQRITVRGNIFNASLTNKVRYNICEGNGTSADSSGYNIFDGNQIINKGATGDYKITAATSQLRKNAATFKNARDYGAVGDGVADDTAALQALLDDIELNSGAAYIPSGQYRITSGLTKTFNAGGVYTLIRRACIFGDGAGNTQILWDGALTGDSAQATFNVGTYALTLQRSGSVGPGNGMISPIEGIGIQPINSGKNYYASGLKLLKWAYGDIRNIWVQSMNQGVWLEEVLNTKFSFLMLISNKYGLRSKGNPTTGLWANNAISLDHAIIASNAYGGFEASDGTFNWKGGSCEQNAQSASAGTGFGIKVHNVVAGTQVACNLDGVYFEANGTTGDPGVNAAKADVYIVHDTTAENHAYNIRGCSFNRLSANYAPQAIFISKTSSTAAMLNINDNVFTNGAGYSPSANCKYVDFSGSNLHLINITASGNYFNQASESPDFISGKMWFAGVLPSFIRIKSFAVLLYKTNAQSIANNTLTAISWDGVDSNVTDCDVDTTHSMFRPATNNTRIYAPPGATRMEFRTNLSYDNSGNANAVFQSVIRKNGAAFRGQGKTQIQSTGVAPAVGAVSSVVVPVVGGTDYFDVGGLQTSGGAMNVVGEAAGIYSTWFSARVIE